LADTLKMQMLHAACHFTTSSLYTQTAASLVVKRKTDHATLGQFLTDVVAVAVTAATIDTSVI